MRLIAAIFLISFGMIAGAVAQQNNAQPANAPDSTSPQAQSAKSKKKNAKTEPAATPKAEEKNPAQPNEPSAAPKAEHEKSEASKEADKGEDKEEHFDLTEVAPIVTHHQITVDGKLLKYTATAGRLPIKRGDGKIEAEMFFVAYTLDGQNAGSRPLTFAFNGGPGSASIWLHMGALGPKRVVLNPDGFLPPAPYHLMDNPYTLLDKSDLVMVDAIGTGFSRAGEYQGLPRSSGA